MYDIGGEGRKNFMNYEQELILGVLPHWQCEARSGCDGIVQRRMHTGTMELGV
ncbi:MAG: hypothetical protein JWR19_3787 [Pedosphaera sp.]|nr:hypothetical protein [Pedosphaera sp.]